MWKSLKSWVVGAVAVVTGLVATAASAVVALDPAISTGFTTVEDNFTALLALAYPYMIMITTGLIVFGLVKMFIHKGAGK